MIASMKLLSLPLNLLNVLAFRLVLAIGVDYGIYVLLVWQRSHDIERDLSGVIKPVTLAGLTAIAGFGSLILAQHRGIRSLGYVMSLGIATCMIAGLTFLPALLNLLPRLKLLTNTQDPACNRAPVSDAAAAGRWLSEIFEPTIASIPRELLGKRAAAEIFHEILEHRWFLSEHAGRDVGLEKAKKSYIDQILRTAADEKLPLL